MSLLEKIHKFEWTVLSGNFIKNIAGNLLTLIMYVFGVVVIKVFICLHIYNKYNSSIFAAKFLMEIF
jgi:hypothetical protein